MGLIVLSFASFSPRPFQVLLSLMCVLFSSVLWSICRPLDGNNNYVLRFYCGQFLSLFLVCILLVTGRTRTKCEKKDTSHV